MLGSTFPPIGHPATDHSSHIQSRRHQGFANDVTRDANAFSCPRIVSVDESSNHHNKIRCWWCHTEVPKTVYCNFCTNFLFVSKNEQASAALKNCVHDGNTQDWTNVRLVLYEDCKVGGRFSRRPRETTDDGTRSAGKRLPLPNSCAPPCNPEPHDSDLTVAAPSRLIDRSPPSQITRPFPVEEICFWSESAVSDRRNANEKMGDFDQDVRSQPPEIPELRKRDTDSCSLSCARVKRSASHLSFHCTSHAGNDETSGCVQKRIKNRERSFNNDLSSFSGFSSTKPPQSILQVKHDGNTLSLACIKNTDDEVPLPGGNCSSGSSNTEGLGIYRSKIRKLVTSSENVMSSKESPTRRRRPSRLSFPSTASAPLPLTINAEKCFSFVEHWRTELQIDAI
eukprot:Selendium_serpulae@DN6137_c0_g1_i4.p1